MCIANFFSYKSVALILKNLYCTSMNYRFLSYRSNISNNKYYINVMQDLLNLKICRPLVQ